MKIIEIRDEFPPSHAAYILSKLKERWDSNVQVSFSILSNDLNPGYVWIACKVPSHRVAAKVRRLMCIHSEMLTRLMA